MRTKLRNIKITRKEILGGIVRTLSKLGVLLVFFWLLFYLMIQYPAVQTRLVQYASNRLTEMTGFPTTVEGVSINWFDLIALDGVKIMDTKGVPLIDVGELKVDCEYKLLVQNDGDIHLDKVWLKDVSVIMVQDSTTNLSNMDEWIDALSGKPDSVNSSGKSGTFSIGKAYVEQGHYELHFPEKAPADKMQFDQYHMVFDQLYGEVTNFRVVGDTIALDVRDLRGYELSSEVKIHELDTDFYICKTGMSFGDLFLKLGRSSTLKVKDQLDFKYDSYKSFSSFFDSVSMTATLDRSDFVTDDLVRFLPFLHSYNDRYKISGRFDGTISDFEFINADISFGDSSRVVGDLSFGGFPELDSTDMKLRLEAGTYYLPKDIYQYAPTSSHETIGLLGSTAIADADFKGYLSDFTLKGIFDTSLGRLEPNMYVNMNKEVYKGLMSMNRFDLGTFFDQKEVIKDVDGYVRFDGVGYSLKKLRLNSRAEIERINLKGYDYKHISVPKFIYNNKQFDVYATVQDPNLNLTFESLTDFEKDKFNTMIELDAPDLKVLHLMDSTLGIKSHIIADFDGTQWGSLDGTVRMVDSKLFRKGYEVLIDEFDISTDHNKETGDRNVLFDSDFATFKASGQYELNTVISDLYKLINQLLENARADTEKVDMVLDLHKELTDIEQYNMSFELKNKDLNKLIHLFDSTLLLSRNLEARGGFHTGKLDYLNLEIDADSLQWGDYQFLGNYVGMAVAKEKGKRNVDFQMDAKSDKQDFEGVKLANLTMTSSNIDSLFNMDAVIEHPSSGDRLEFLSELIFYKDSMVLDFPESKFRLMDNNWSNDFGRKNRIILGYNGEVKIDDLGFESGEKYLYANGFISEDYQKKLKLNIHKFDLGILERVLGYSFRGQLNINAEFEDLYQHPRMLGEVSVDDVYVDDYFVGNLKGDSEWDGINKRFSVEASLTRNERKVLKLSGSYEPTAPKDRMLDMTMILDGADLKIAESFSKDVVSNLEGTLIGLVNIKGSLEDPILWGDAYIANGSFLLNYTKVRYHFSDKIYIRSNGIYGKNLRLIDNYDNYCYVNGGVYYKDFDNFRLDINARMQNFQGLNTTEKDNGEFYGNVFGTGTVKLAGSFDDMSLSISGKTEKNTKIFIPLSDDGVVEDQSYIRYYDSNKISEDKTVVDISNSRATDSFSLKLDMDIELTQEAYCELIFDKKSGDIIRGNGVGKLQMSMTPQGDLTMFGKVEILKGAYNFTMRMADFNLLDKRFSIEPNSSITWAGDPYGAELNITAAYEQKVSLSPIITDADSIILNAPEVKRRYPVNVLLDMSGKISRPQLDFDIEIQDYPNTIVTSQGTIPMDSYVQAYRQRLQNDEQELNRQVFSLIVMKRLAPENNFGGFTTSAGNSVSELLSNQLSYMLSQVDENFEIDLDLNGLDEEAWKALQLRFTYTFLQGRVRISRDGGFTNSKNETDAASILGDWTVEVALTPQGNFRAKFYQRHNEQIYSGLEGNTTTGASILHTKSFNTLSDIFGKNKKKKKEENELKEKIKELERKEKAKRKADRKTNDETVPPLEEQKEENKQEEKETVPVTKNQEK
ncbi:translocation/assembly module TamB domain-containing protein [Limibacter armeniacum]|uniref:translocation/assembly module TamB domain-containing protein n=1 Tax=Limibacter armeniacum TaxID=466084 RepID=UPI002FE65200